MAWRPANCTSTGLVVFVAEGHGAVVMAHGRLIGLRPDGLHGQQQGDAKGCIGFFHKDSFHLLQGLLVVKVFTKIDNLDQYGNPPSATRTRNRHLVTNAKIHVTMRWFFDCLFLLIEIKNVSSQQKRQNQKLYARKQRTAHRVGLRGKHRQEHLPHRQGRHRQDHLSENRGGAFAQALHGGGAHRCGGRQCRRCHHPFLFPIAFHPLCAQCQDKRPLRVQP